MLREGSFALASFGRVRKVHETAFAVAFGRKSVALKRILDAAFESRRPPGEATFADLMDVLRAILFLTCRRGGLLIVRVDDVQIPVAIDGQAVRGEKLAGFGPLVLTEAA